MSKMIRKEINGLRALAVISVILFHADFTFFSGGYIGVDVFFVISGYLITQLIIKEIKIGTFSLLKFYERRARRLLPALFFLILVSIFISLLFMPSFNYQNFSKSILSVVFFISNIFFYKQSGYFSENYKHLPQKNISNNKPQLKIITKKIIKASFAETTMNSRARSAKLRAAEKI